MEEIFDKSCGLDVHRDSITACVMVGNGAQKRKTIKTFPAAPPRSGSWEYGGFAANAKILLTKHHRQQT